MDRSWSMNPERIRRWLRAGALALAWCAAQVSAQPAAQTRVAVVIGNGAYRTAPLPNTVNDAAAVSAALRDAGFSVIELRDGSRAQMQDAVDRAAMLLRGRNGVGLFYFAGHGLQLDWHNYLVPVDAKVATAAEVRATAMNLQAVLDAFRVAGNRVSILVVDACRDNPYADSAGGRGLAQMDAPPGTLLAFATAPGRVAEDGNPVDGNGVYTHYLVREMRHPAAKVEDVFKRVRAQVRKHSEGRQVPWESTSLEDDFFFDPAARVTTLADADRAREVSAERARERAEWQRIRQSTEPGDFTAFLARWDRGEFAEVAELRLYELRQLIARAKPGEPIQLPDVRNRYATGDAFTYVVVDGYTQLESVATWHVIFADNEHVEFNNGQVLTQLGATVRDSRGYRFDPPRQELPSSLQVGQAWRSEFKTWRGPATGGGGIGRSDYKVVAREALQLPAGVFDAFKIEIDGQADQGFPLTYKSTAWFDAQTMLLVRLDLVQRRGVRIELFHSLRLANMTRAPRWGE